MLHTPSEENGLFGLKMKNHLYKLQQMGGEIQPQLHEPHQAQQQHQTSIFLPQEED